MDTEARNQKAQPPGRAFRVSAQNFAKRSEEAPQRSPPSCAFFIMQTDPNKSATPPPPLRCIPWGDSERYDSVVTLGQSFLRVQIKSAARYAETRYRVRTTGSSYTVYTPAEIDFLVAYIVPEDLWYIIPASAIGHRKGIRFYPHTRHPS